MAATKADCVFCKIAGGELDARRVLETTTCVAFLDAAPLAPGHTLVIPKAHFEGLHDMPEDVVREVAVATRRVGRAIREAVGAAGYNVLQNNGTVAGQVVMHVHYHIIPRIEGDGLGYRWTPIPGEATRDEELASRIAESIRVG
ncbi:MAG: HIT family protein [Planctomycetes bacterium]|nr:HIT family protein [Planctomycetota bacterium]